MEQLTHFCKNCCWLRVAFLVKHFGKHAQPQKEITRLFNEVLGPFIINLGVALLGRTENNSYVLTSKRLIFGRYIERHRYVENQWDLHEDVALNKDILHIKQDKIII